MNLIENAILQRRRYQSGVGSFRLSLNRHVAIEKSRVVRREQSLLAPADALITAPIGLLTVVLLAPSSECESQEMVTKINDSVKKRGIKVNVSKTKVVAVKKSESTTVSDVYIEAYSRGERAGEPSVTKWLPRAIDTCNPIGVASINGVSYQRVAGILGGNRISDSSGVGLMRGRGGCTGTLNHWTKFNRTSC
ncbi:hypothetical protein EVAR_28127_1 [Eumeta japonica]|uniref:Uncharacterized protein n=1 Tax=Eumeta variegata TaxID=151549 RepID=A0A4C1VDA7_EUMVA|nr:hypothetical protein EVAR_28127_1 [Eumeta japonica]